MNFEINKLVKICKYYPISESCIILEEIDQSTCSVLGILRVTTNSLDKDILDTTDSFQIRPKIIHKNTKGFYIDNPRTYLNEDIVDKIINYLD